MAKEILGIPEDNLQDVINVIREGLKHCKVSEDTKENLEKWCKDEEEYLNG